MARKNRPSIVCIYLSSGQAIESCAIKNRSCRIVSSTGVADHSRFLPKIFKFIRVPEQPLDSPGNPGMIFNPDADLPFLKPVAGTFFIPRERIECQKRQAAGGSLHHRATSRLADQKVCDEHPLVDVIQPSERLRIRKRAAAPAQFIFQCAVLSRNEHSLERQRNFLKLRHNLTGFAKPCTAKQDQDQGKIPPPPTAR